MNSLPSNVLLHVLPFASCVRDHGKICRVSQSWQLAAKSPQAWEHAKVDLSIVQVPAHMATELANLWSMIDLVFLTYPNLHVMKALNRPCVFRSDWASPESDTERCSQWRSWHKIRMPTLNTNCFVCMSQWPVQHIVELRLNSYDLCARCQGGCAYPAPGQEFAFSIGWSNAQSHLQFARVATGENMLPTDFDIHACLLRFPHGCSHCSQTRAKVQLHYLCGPVPGGYERSGFEFGSRIVDLNSPFYVLKQFDMMLEMDIQANLVRLKINNDLPIETVSFFLQASTRNLMDLTCPHWRFFVYAEGRFPPNIDCILLDMKSD